MLVLGAAGAVQVVSDAVSPDGRPDRALRDAAVVCGALGEQPALILSTVPGPLADAYRSVAATLESDPRLAESLRAGRRTGFPRTVALAHALLRERARATLADEVESGEPSPSVRR
ncbi:hypothetical protein [Mumia quercus]|uniref:hypothetical protein n=1 Tax=Mumia quercus TaxID=2976125 RepID=UPI0021D09A69|nr:hypothetical protein [Mumia quercus]